MDVVRTTRETDVRISLDRTEGTPDRSAARIDTSVPFLDHMLTAFAYHGGFDLAIAARGDTHIDDHHTVEDVGIVLGQAFRALAGPDMAVARFAHDVVVMDDARAATTIDVCGRSYLVFEGAFAQPSAGRFDLSLVREFFQGLVGQAAITLHLEVQAGINGHHQAEALFKSAGRAFGVAYAQVAEVRSTKGTL